MLQLAKHIGRELAHEAVSEAVRSSSAAGKTFAESLVEHPAIAGRLGEEELNALLDPDVYIGVAAQLVDEILEKGDADD